jgi:AcrR family transcriptional regulator
VSSTQRRQRPRGTITRDAVVFAALAVVDRVGCHSLTIRAVARQVGAPPMSLYTHFANKDELLDLMYAEVIRHLYSDERHETWQEELLALCRRIYATLIQHPNWMPLLGRAAKSMDVPVRERLLAMMAKDEINPDLAFSMMTSAAVSTMGFVLAQLTFRDPASGQSRMAQRIDALREWAENAEGAPLTREAVITKGEFDMPDMFERTAIALLKGYEQMARDARQVS